MSRPVYATVTGRDGSPVRLGAEVGRGGDNGPADMALVWVSGGGMLGWYRLERFEGRRLTARTLAGLFAPTFAVAALEVTP